MNERSIVSSEPEPQGNWLDNFMPNNQVGHHEPRQQFVDIATLRGILFRQRWLIAGVIAAAVIAGLVITLLATPLYVARSSVQIEPYGAAIVEGSELDGFVPPNQIDSYLSTQMAVITSRSLARKVAEDLDLAQRDGFLADGAEGAANAGNQAAQNARLEAATNRLENSVLAEVPMENWIIEIGYRSEDPAFAAEVANAYADAYARLETEGSLSDNEYARDYLREQIDTVRQEMQKAEQKANQYARANGIVVAPVSLGDGASVGTTITAANLGDINARVSAAQAARIEAEQRWRSIQGLPATQLVEVQSNALLQSLIAERAAKQTELTEKRQRLLDTHPDIISLNAQLETLNNQISRTTSDIKSAVRNDYVVARNQEQALKSQLNSSKGESLEEQDLRVEYGALYGEAEALRTQLDALLTRFNQLNTASDVESTSVRLLDYATVPQSPVSPSLPRNLGLALVFGIALAGGLAVLRESLDNKIRSLEDVEQRVGIRLLGHTPNLAENDIEYDSTNKFSPLIEAYASIHAAMDYLIPRGNAVVQLTSSQATEGKSTTAIILAELFAGSGRKTLLIDGDLRRPSIASLMDVKKPRSGLVEVLEGQSTLESALLKGAHYNLDVIPISKKPTNPSEVIGSAQFREFLEACRQNYSMVIIDSAPVLGLADAPMISRMVDGTVFVMAANEVNFGQIKNAKRRLESSGGKVIGGILTKYRALEAGESYGYQYAYYKYDSSSKDS